MAIVYSHLERKHARRIQRIVGITRSPKTLRKRLVRKGFSSIGEGCYKETFFSEEFPSLIIKIYSYRNAFKSDSTPKKLSVRAAAFFLTPLIHNSRFIIQKKYNKRATQRETYQAGLRAYDKIKEVLGDKEPKDLQHNCCWYKRKPYFFDYIT